MITVIAATNRAKSKTLSVAKEVLAVLQQITDEKVILLDLAKVDFTLLNESSYQSVNAYAHALRAEFLIPAKQFVVIIPEYNGSFSGILKYFIDLISTVDFQTTFQGKGASLIGVAAGRAGNLNGLTQFASVLMHMGVHVSPLSLPISSINDHLTEEGKLLHKTQKMLQEHLSNMIITK